MKINIYEEVEYSSGDKKFTIKGMSSAYFDLKGVSAKTDADKKKIIDDVKSRHDDDELKKICMNAMPESASSMDKQIVKVELVIAKNSRYVPGTYYAHEYDQYVAGKGRKITYSNGHVEYEIKCLDKSLKVMDGIWEEYQSNGCGDTFEPNKPLG